MIVSRIRNSKHIVVFTGAGMSTESGIPDFRSNNGLWKGKNPEELASVRAMKSNRSEFVKFYRKRIEVLKSVKPYPGYEILSRWGENHNFKSVITQNTDGFHEQAGNKSTISLHGTIQKMHCHKCKSAYTTDVYFNGEFICNCGGFIRPSVVLFGELLDYQILELAQQEAQKSDLFIVLGSSLVVSPANMLPVIAKENGANLINVNNEPTPLDSVADIVVNDRKIGDFLKEVSISLL